MKKVPFTADRVPGTSSLLCVCGWMPIGGRAAWWFTCRTLTPRTTGSLKSFPPTVSPGTWGSQIIDVLAPQPDERVLPKTRYSGFYGTDLENILAAYGPDEVEVVGVCTSICVMDTVGGLANRDYRTVVPRAGVADFDDDAHRHALDRMERLYGATIQ
jgi:nicotinamidase/pyrazinamidase